jgi:hypothetical protein
MAVTPGLSYCNYCGAKLSGAKGESVSEAKEVRPELLVSAMAGVFILGLVAITMLMGMMKQVLGLPVENVLLFALLPFLILLLLEGVFLRLLFRRKRSTAKTGGAITGKGQATRELDATHARGLSEHVPSVTEHTTRVLDPIYTDRE